MFSTGAVRKTVENVQWQDYRSSAAGMILTYDTDPVSEMAIREVPEEFPSTVEPEPNYETGTYGLYGCVKTKLRTAFAKGKYRYLFFMAKYAGSNEKYRDKYLITGYYRIKKTSDVLKLHLRYLTDTSCLEADSCIALFADEVHFVNLRDAIEMTEAVLGEWGFKSRITKQTRILLSDEQTAKLLGELQAKPNVVDKYIEETRRLQPHDPESTLASDGETEESDGDADVTASAESEVEGDEVGPQAQILEDAALDTAEEQV